eukprot:Blabericola_migrator_1__4133@NODE_2261_length_3041_cov_64_008406_g1423_i0_p1_GENE_NODE_2261_length_3041_cov_64_008406_g1423_i0NODE_2261_length_3041_cov_64_008406_g1423_i0_p1_ORF_typecomplete_len771_score112_54_NODE_2261_length_3041_cov_64_008406_g1423_i05972909
MYSERALAGRKKPVMYVPAPMFDEEDKIIAQNYIAGPGVLEQDLEGTLLRQWTAVTPDIIDSHYKQCHSQLPLTTEAREIAEACNQIRRRWVLVDDCFPDNFIIYGCVRVESFEKPEHLVAELAAQILSTSRRKDREESIVRRSPDAADIKQLLDELRATTLKVAIRNRVLMKAVSHASSLKERGVQPASPTSAMRGSSMPLASVSSHSVPMRFGPPIVVPETHTVSTSCGTRSTSQTTQSLAAKSPPRPLVPKALVGSKPSVSLGSGALKSAGPRSAISKPKSIAQRSTSAPKLAGLISAPRPRSMPPCGRSEGFVPAQEAVGSQVSVTSQGSMPPQTSSVSHVSKSQVPILEIPHTSLPPPSSTSAAPTPAAHLDAGAGSNLTCTSDMRASQAPWTAASALVPSGEPQARTMIPHHSLSSPDKKLRRAKKLSVKKGKQVTGANAAPMGSSESWGRKNIPSSPPFKVPKAAIKASRASKAKKGHQGVKMATGANLVPLGARVPPCAVPGTAIASTATPCVGPNTVTSDAVVLSTGSKSDRSAQLCGELAYAWKRLRKCHARFLNKRMAFAGFLGTPRGSDFDEKFASFKTSFATLGANLLCIGPEWNDLLRTARAELPAHKLKEYHPFDQAAYDFSLPVPTKKWPPSSPSDLSSVGSSSALRVSLTWPATEIPTVSTVPSTLVTSPESPPVFPSCFDLPQKSPAKQSDTPQDSWERVPSTLDYTLSPPPKKSLKKLRRRLREALLAKLEPDEDDTEEEATPPKKKLKSS